MRFEWNPEKARSNLIKHKVRFEVAQAVFDDPFHVILPDRFVDGEERWHAIGMVREVTVLLVVHVYPNADDLEAVRIIGARRATSTERRRYEQE